MRRHMYWVEWLELWWRCYCLTERGYFYQIFNIVVHFGSAERFSQFTVVHIYLVFSIPQWFWCTIHRAFLYKIFVSTILSFFKRMLICKQSSCEMFEKGCNFDTFFGQLLFLKAFNTKFIVSSIWVPCLILSISMI